MRKILWKLLPYRHDQVSQEQFELLYASGRLDWYRDISELARYSVVIGYCHYFKPAGAILDIGCGEGILQERLAPYSYSRYVGVDFSKTAISRAADKQDEKTCFVMADINTYVTDEQFNIIIFNECLFYINDHLSLMKRYEDYLKDDGLFIVSACDHERVKKVWKIIEAVYPVGDEVHISHKPNLSWTVKVLMPSKSSQTFCAANEPIS
jgi:2-polyprenyl-3-methyl-5-hydroxy-6-metoxy-1,4-benzoquinol methylase